MRAARAGRVLAAIDHLPQAIGILDRNGRFEYANAPLLALVELSADGVVGRDAEELIGGLRADWIPIEEGRLVVVDAAAAGELVVAQERERSRIARDLHDTAVQMLAATLIRLDRARLQEPLTPRVRALLGDLEGDLRSTYAELRAVLFNLRPETLTKNGLVAATRELLERLADDTAIDWSLDHRLAGRECGERGLLAFRVLQEALTNVRKHAGATTVAVSIGGEERLDVSIEDDGRGFDPAVAEARALDRHLGLTTMRERVEVAGGRFELASAAGRGTRIRLSLPGARR